MCVGLHGEPFSFRHAFFLGETCSLLRPAAILSAEAFTRSNRWPKNLSSSSNEPRRATFLAATPVRRILCERVVNKAKRQHGSRRVAAP
jgi:hypothetical protein